MKLPALDWLILQLSRQLSEEDAELIKYTLNFSSLDREMAGSSGELLSLLQTRHKTTYEFVAQLRELLCLSDTKNKEKYREVLNQFDTRVNEVGDDCESLHGRQSLAMAASLHDPPPRDLQLAFRWMLGRVARRVSRRDMETMRAILVRTESDRQSIKMTEHLFEVLERQGCFGPEDIDYLFELFEVFEDSGALQNFHTYHQQHLQQRQAPPNFAPPSHPISESRPSHTASSSLSSIRSVSVTPGTPNTPSSSHPPHTHSSCPSHLQSHSPVTFEPRTLTIARNSIFPNDSNMLQRKRPTNISQPRESPTHATTPNPPSKRKRLFNDQSSVHSSEESVEPTAPPPPPPPPTSDQDTCTNLSTSSPYERPFSSSSIVVPRSPNLPPSHSPHSQPKSINMSVTPLVYSHPQPVQPESVYTHTSEIMQAPEEEASVGYSEQCVSNHTEPVRSEQRVYIHQHHHPQHQPQLSPQQPPPPQLPPPQHPPTQHSSPQHPSDVFPTEETGERSLQGNSFVFSNSRPNFNHLLPNQQMQSNESEEDDESSIAEGGAMYETSSHAANMRLPAIDESREYENQESSESTNESTSKTSESQSTSKTSECESTSTSRTGSSCTIA